MENASKALIIIGEVLIAVLILSLLVGVFSAFGNFSAEMHNHMAESQKIEFNSHFINMENRINITAQEVATIINYVKQVNDEKELDYNTRTSSEYYTTVYLYGVNGKNKVDVFNSSSFIDTADEYNNNLQNLLAEFISNNNIYYFSCKADVTKNGEKLNIDYTKNSDDIVYNENTGLITSISFHRIDYDIINVLTYSK